MSPHRISGANVFDSISADPNKYEKRIRDASATGQREVNRDGTLWLSYPTAVSNLQTHSDSDVSEHTYHLNHHLVVTSEPTLTTWLIPLAQIPHPLRQNLAGHPTISSTTSYMRDLFKPSWRSPCCLICAFLLPCYLVLSIHILSRGNINIMLIGTNLHRE